MKQLNISEYEAGQRLERLLAKVFPQAFSSSSLSAIRVVSSAYLKLLIFLPTILIPACASSSQCFLC